MTMPFQSRMAERCILLVEDEYFIADELRRTFEAEGATVLGPVHSVQIALDLLAESSQVDGAVLDINLRDVMIYSVADALIARHIPFIFATGYDKGSIPARYRGIRRCEKPLASSDVAQALLDCFTPQ